MATRPPARRRSRPARPLALIFVVLAALSTLVIVKDWKPRQGLDLVGGTSVILTPEGEQRPSSGALASAVEIIRRRVNGTGVTSAEVVTEGENVRVSLPNVGRAEALRIVGTTAELTFRPVTQTLNPGPATASPAPAPTATPSGTPRPSGSATPRPTASATATSNQRAIASALLPAQASPTPTPTPSRPATPSGTATPRPTASPASPAPDVAKALAEVDCADPVQRAEIADTFGDPSMNTKEIVSCDVDGGAKYLLGPSEMGGQEIRNALATIQTDGNGVSTGQWIIELTLKSAGKWADLTEKYTNQQLAIVLDGITQSAPTIQERIPSGVATISGDFNESSAKTLANVLKYGSLPVQFEQSQTQTISATLGERSLDGALLAGLLGLGAVLLYAIFYYRSLGLVTIVGMLIFAASNFLAIVILGQTIGFTLTLAGIAGLIVSVGISADSYVVFYERLRDELRSGRSVQAGVERGFSRAFMTILTADGVSFLAALILYVLSVGEVRGFAFTLGLATMIDVVVAWFYTRPTVTLLARTRMFREGRFGGLAGTSALREA